MLKIGSVTFEDLEGETPLTPSVSPRARRGQLLEGLSLSNEVVTFTGISQSYSIRWASGTSHGLLPVAKVRALVNLYENGGEFEIQTDMLIRELDDVKTYPGCYFEPGLTPVFAPSEVLDLWLFDFVTRIPVAVL